MNVKNRNRLQETINKDIENFNAINKDVIVIQELIQTQNEYFSRGATRPTDFRKESLKRLKDAVIDNEDDILRALQADLGKPPFEAYASELALFYQELKYALKHVKKWTKTKKVSTPLFLQQGKSQIVPEPYGTVLIIGPWNYPFQLTLTPLVGAIAAGNTAVIKPSEHAPRTAAVIARVIEQAFNRQHVAVVQGGVDVSKTLLNNRFDYIFFTGGPGIGKIIMEAAAKHLTPVTLELGGKSPVIVHDDASIDVAARRIAWGKFLNAGQTCLAPDYVLAQKKIKKQLIERIAHYTREFYGEDPEKSEHYARIINTNHFNRLNSLLKKGRIAHGGTARFKKKYIEPTIIDEPSLKFPVMREEIFGPILPVLSYETLADAVQLVNSMPKPLALYLFTNSKKTIETIIQRTSSGSVCINDTVIQVSNHNLPFGGVGHSGMGSYHGKYSFETFSHMKSVFKKSKLFEIPFRFPPYEKSVSLLRKIFR